MLRHGVKRGVYVAPLASNTIEFLNGDSSKLKWYKRPLPEIVSFWRERWLLPRAARDESYLEFDAKNWHSILNLKEVVSKP
jgi:hypothetical protein